jgi:hypothetical protein
MCLSYRSSVSQKKAKNASLLKGTRQRRKPGGVSTGLTAIEL